MAAVGSLGVSFAASDVDYQSYYSARLAPEWLDAVAVLSGVAPPARDRIRLCELGCGRGVSTVVHAALRPQDEFVGIDLMPRHIDFASRLAADAGADNARFLAADFADVPAALGTFDYVVAHGVYSWIDEAGVEALYRFVDRHLAPGGLLYLSYNAMPGWAADLPFQHLLRALSVREAGTSDQRVLAACAVVQKLLDSGARGLRHSLVAREWQGQRPSYLAHEYLASGWRASWVEDVWRDMAGFGLAPAGSAVIQENFDAMMLTRDQREALTAFDDDAPLREMVRDVLLNRRFRCDVYARDAATLGAPMQRERLLDMRFALLSPPGLIDYSFATPAGRVAIDNAVTRAIVGRLAERPRRLGDCNDGTFTDADIVAGALSLFAAELIAPAAIRASDPARLNAALRAMAEGTGAGLIALASGTALWFSEGFPPVADRLRSDGGRQWLDFLRTAAPGAIVDCLVSPDAR